MSIKWLVLALATRAFAETFPAADVKVLGSIDYGQTSAPVHYASPPKYRAFEFNARPGDHLEIWIHARKGVPTAFLADSNFQSIAGGKAHFPAIIPRQSQPATYYVIFYESSYKPGDFAVELQRPSGTRAREQAP